MSTLKKWDICHGSSPKLMYICDRCGKYIETEIDDVFEGRIKQVPYQQKETMNFHFCNDCRNKFKKWIDRERRKWC